MMSNTPPEQDMQDQGPDQGLEALSALFDGELQGDAARFALKRLGHDPRWRQALGDWQLLGDALRKQASIVAPRDFAARVAVAVAADPVAVTAVASTMASGASAVSGLRRRWFGGAALAASVAMVAMLVARPFSQDPVVTPGAATPTELAMAPAATAAVVPATVTPALAGTALQVGVAAVAVAEVPRRASERRSRGQSQRAALRAPKRQLSVPATASAVTATALAADEAGQVSPVDPFHPTRAEAVVRPWPRAVLPAAPATGAFTASYGSAGSPSFYPFEPRLPSADAALSADAQHP